MLTRRAFGAFALALAALLPLAAQAQERAFPVTLEHVYGKTVIENKPERIVTIGWTTQDAVLALGEVPVAIPEQKWGGNANGVLPWTADAIVASGKATPRIINFDTEIPYEDVLAVAPDLILAPYSGITQEQHERLSAIAPTVAYADKPWAGSWQEITRVAGQALGKPAQAETLIASIDERLAAAAAAHPEFAGKSFTFGALWVGEAGMNVYSTTDPRVVMVTQLGLKPSPGVAALPTDSYYTTVSYEQLDTLDADVLISLDEGDEASDALYANELVQRFKPVAEGRMLRLKDKSFVMATSAPSPLGIPWMLDRFVPELAAVMQK